jgi:hypothetical protein
VNESYKSVDFASAAADIFHFIRYNQKITVNETYSSRNAIQIPMFLTKKMLYVYYISLEQTSVALSPQANSGSSGQGSWLQIQMSRVRFPELPDFLTTVESGTGSTQPCADKLAT